MTLKNTIARTTVIVAAWASLACEDIVHPTLEYAAPVLVVDAWVTNLPGSQVVTLTWSQTYFDSTVPTGATGALVSIVDNSGQVYPFVEDGNKPGSYKWVPGAGEVFGVVGKSYSLSIFLGGETFVSTTRMGRVPPIDSITFETDKRIGSTDSITRAEFWGTDPEGPGDAYWIRSYKNGTPLLRPSELNLAFDAGLSFGGGADGVTFIAPVRRRINSVDQDADGRNLNPIAEGDSMQVQIHSVSVAAFTYLNEVGIQTNRPGGFAELFATPLANVSTNIVNANPNGSKALGFFNVSAVSTAGKRFAGK